MTILWAALCGFVLDLLFGDPEWLPHPVVIMGKYISFFEKKLRPRFPKTPQGERIGGTILAIGLPVCTLLVSGAILSLLGIIHPLLRFALEALWCGQALAMKGLRDESDAVRIKLIASPLDDARRQVSRIVGRDTETLTCEGVAKAAVETVAENFSDGVMAPMLYMMLGGAPMALCYKAINTMDSMIGYKTDRFLYFGRSAARLDDLANLIPSRLSALLLIAAAIPSGQNAAGAWRIWRRDRYHHASPNSAQTEAAMAGALGVQLGGPASYFGQYHDKPTIGDALRPVVPEDIRTANRMLYTAGFAGFILLAAARLLIVH